jgi:hypothetical protein
VVLLVLVTGSRLYEGMDRVRTKKADRIGTDAVALGQR